MNRLVRMAVRMLLRQGVDAYAKRNSQNAKDDPVARKQAAQTNKRARQSMRIMRRFFRF